MRPEGHKVVVIGAQGVLGGLCAKALGEAGFDVIRAGRHAESSSDFRLVDLDDDASIHECCGDADIVVSTVRHPDFAAERFALREGRALLSVASFRRMGRPGTHLAVVFAGWGPSGRRFKSGLPDHRKPASEAGFHVEELCYLDIYEDGFEEEQFADWVKQASKLPGEDM